MRPVVAVLMTLASVTACGGGPGATTPAPASTTTPVTRPAAPASSMSPAGAGHVVVVIFENKAYRQVAGSADAPYLNGLLSRSAVFSNAHGVAHPSQPNYLALFSGSTQGVTDDHCPVTVTGKPNLAEQLIAAGDTFTGYAEDLPSAGYRGCSTGRYAAKHNPWADFDNVPAGADQPYSAWPGDLATLPTVAFVVPNLCNDMHDCPISTGDGWARTHLEPYLHWADTHDSLLVVTFDENDGSSGNQILTIVAGARVSPGVRTESVNHYSILRTIEDRYGLPAIGAATNAAPLHVT